MALFSESGFRKIFDAVRTRGIHGVKAYMCGNVQLPNILHLNVSVLINEAW